MIALIEHDLESFINNSPLKEQLHYAVFPGKRLRASLLLTLLKSHEFAYSEQVIAAASAIELTHAFSLVHDDMPALDNATLRRGKLSFFKKYGESNALLVGDMLQYLAMSRIQEFPALLSKLVEYSGPGGMVFGQWLECNTKPRNAQELQRIQDLKTAKLFELAALMAEMILPGNFSLQAIGLKIGRCLQWLDDIHDEAEDQVGTNVLHFRAKTEVLAELQQTLSAIKRDTEVWPKGHYLRTWLELNFEQELFRIESGN